MNYGTSRRDKHVLQFRSAGNGLSSAFNRDASSLSNLSLIDTLEHGAPISEFIDLQNTLTVKSSRPSSRQALHHQEFIEGSPDLRTASTIPRSKATAPALTMQITISAESVTTLRRIIIRTFGEMVAFMRIQSIDHATKMKVFLCLTAPIAGRVMEVIMHTLPCAEFGRITKS